MSNVWFTSDLHIGHKLVAVTRYQVDGKPIWHNGEPIPEWFGQDEIDRHDQLLADKWDDVVRDGDVVYVQGDICSGTDKSYLHALQWIQDRPGRKILIHGNHDPINGMHRDASKWAVDTRQAFISDHAYLRRRVPLVGEGHQDILLCHFPYTDEYTGIGQAGRFDTYRLHDGGLPIVHGHTHSKRKVSTSSVLRGEVRPYVAYPRTLQLHVGVDAWDGSPCPLSWIVSEVQGWVAMVPSPIAEKPSEPVLRTPANPDYPQNAPGYVPYASDDELAQRYLRASGDPDMLHAWEGMS